MVAVISLVFLAAVIAGDPRLPVGNSALSLRTLDTACSLEERPTGVVAGGDDLAIWLVCDRKEFLVLHPNNLAGHMKIETPDDALDFVRFFSRIHGSVPRIDGMVEVVARRDASLDFNEVDPAVFSRHFVAPYAKVAASAPTTFEGRKLVAGGRSFAITRTCFFPDGTVRIVEERVWETGYYGLVSSRVVLKGAEIGMSYFMPGH